MSFRVKDLLILSGICFLCFFWRLGAVGLFDFNEGFYTQVAREMYLRGDYVTPRVNGILFFDKPPLALWLSALSFHLFGVNEFAARFPVALAASALVFLTYWFGSRYLNRTAGLLASAMVALNPLFYGTARQMTMDIHQTLWFAVALFSFYAAWHRERTAKANSTTEARRHGVRTEQSENVPAPFTHHASRITSRITSLLYHLFWTACGLGVLAKSVPGLFPIGVVFVFVLVTERFRWRGVLARIWEARILTGLPLMLALVVPWFWLAWKANGRVFYEEFWLLHHVKLASGGDFSHAQPFWYYVPALLAGFFPWSLFLPAALWQRWRDQSAIRNPQSAIAFLLVWVATVFLVFSAMKSKLLSYLLPMYPAAALLAGAWAARVIEARQEREARGLRWSMTAGAVISWVALAAGIAAAHYILTSPHAARQRQDVPAGILEFGVHALIVAAVGMAAAAILAWRGRYAGSVWTVAGAAMAFVALANVEGLGALEAQMNRPLQSLAREAGSRWSPAEPLVIHIGQPRRPSVFFYLPDSAFVGRPLPAPGQDGIILERGEEEPVVAYLSQHRPATILTDKKRAAALMEAVPGLRVLEQRDRWLLLSSDGPTTVARRPDGRR